MFFLDIKMRNTTYSQRNRDIIPNRAKDYYENDKERLREQARDKYRNLSEEDKNFKKEYGKNISQYVWRKGTKTKRRPKKMPRDKKGLNIITKKIMFLIMI